MTRKRGHSLRWMNKRLTKVGLSPLIGVEETPFDETPSWRLPDKWRAAVAKESPPPTVADTIPAPPPTVADTTPPILLRTRRQIALDALQQVVLEQHGDCTAQQAQAGLEKIGIKRGISWIEKELPKLRT
jgi:hypothetical protein